MSNRTDYLHTFFVGREAELRELYDFFSTATSSRQPTFVLVRGDVGVGKTALVEHFLSGLQRQTTQNPAPLIGRGNCAMESEGSGLIPFSQILNSLRADEGAQPYFKSGEALEFLKETAPAWLDILALVTTGRTRTAGGKTAEVDGAASGHTVDSGSGVSRSGGVDVHSESTQIGGDVVGRDKISVNTANITNIYGQSRNSYTQDQVFIQFANALSRLAEKQTIVAFIDDLQWADASSLRLLFHLSRNLIGVPILFICACGPAVALSANPNTALFREICAELVRHGGTVDILNGLDVTQYAAQRYTPNTFTPDFLTRVQKLTDGHAQFVSELFSMWGKDNVIMLVPALTGQPVWTIARDPYFPDVPTSLKPLLDFRIESLTKELQDVLNLASVEGTDFVAEVIAKLRSADELETYDQLEILERDYRFIQVQDDPELAAMSLSFYRFVNRFFRERVYNRLIPAKQRVLHKKVGECLEILYTDRRPIAGQLADHFYKANEVLKAVGYELMAAQFEQSRYAWYEAEERCRTGLEWLKATEKGPGNGDVGKQLRFDLLECSANGLFYSSQFALAGERYTAALSIAANLPVDANRIANLYCRLADVHYYEGHTQQSIQACAAGKQTLLTAGVPFNAIHITLDALAAFMQSQLGHTAAAAISIRGILDRAEALPRRDELEEACGDAYNNLGVILQQLGRYSDSQAAYARAIEIAEKVGQQQLAEMAILNTADNLVQLGLIDQAADYVDRGLRLAQRIGDLDGIETAQSTQSEIFLARGNPHEAIGQLSQAMNRAQEIGSTWNMPYLSVALTKAYLMVDDIDSARRCATQGVKSAEDAGQFELGLTLDALGQVEAAAGNWALADQYFNESMTIHHHADHHARFAHVQRHYAASLLRQGHTPEAADLLRAALVTFNDLDLPQEVRQTQQLLNTIAAS